MKIIQNGTNYSIYDEGLVVKDKLPVGTYTVEFSKASGFFLRKLDDVKIKEDKIYGNIPSKVKKILKSFSLTNKNLGVIASGDKGMGKSLFANLLAIEGSQNDLPLIMVNKYYENLSAFLESIRQEVIILFDEFEKNFDCDYNDNDANQQNELLGLFDGISTGKKLFIITANDVGKISNYLINRTGRFHYHLRFEYPTCQEIEEYLNDKVLDDYKDEIGDVLSLSNYINLNYDMLRSIVFELNQGEKFKDFIGDLNIINRKNNTDYSIVAELENGEILNSSDWIGIIETHAKNGKEYSMGSTKLGQYYAKIKLLSIKNTRDGLIVDDYYLETEDNEKLAAKNIRIVKDVTYNNFTFNF